MRPAALNLDAFREAWLGRSEPHEVATPPLDVGADHELDDFVMIGVVDPAFAHRLAAA